jgi:hypothetical protein
MNNRGPMNIIYDNETDSLCLFEMRNLRVHDLILNPTKESCSWYTPLKMMKLGKFINALLHQNYVKMKLFKSNMICLQDHC